MPQKNILSHLLEKKPKDFEICLPSEGVHQGPGNSFTEDFTVSSPQQNLNREQPASSSISPLTLLLTHIKSSFWMQKSIFPVYL